MIFLFTRDVVLRVAKDSTRNYINKLNYTGTLDLARDTVTYIPNKMMIDNLKKYRNPMISRTLTHVINYLIPLINLSQ